MRTAQRTRKQPSVITNTARAEAARRRELGWIHQGAAALGWSDDDYRYHLRQQTGKDSARDCTPAERAAMLRHLSACGWKKEVKQRPFDQAAKIRWYWRKLEAIGALREPTEAALLSWIAKTTGMQVSHLQFLPTAAASTAIEGLKAWLLREERRAAQGQGALP